jgi:hypothetical protein
MGYYRSNQKMDVVEFFAGIAGNDYFKSNVINRAKFDLKDTIFMLKYLIDKIEHQKSKTL